MHQTVGSIVQVTTTPHNGPPAPPVSMPPLQPSDAGAGQVGAVAGRLWVCGQYRSGIPGAGGAVWEFQGVFDSEARAEAACVTENYFIFPATLNAELPRELVQVEGRWPMLERRYARQESRHAR